MRIISFCVGPVGSRCCPPIRRQQYKVPAGIESFSQSSTHRFQLLQTVSDAPTNLRHNRHAQMKEVLVQAVLSPGSFFEPLISPEGVVDGNEHATCPLPVFCFAQQTVASGGSVVTHFRAVTVFEPTRPLRTITDTHKNTLRPMCFVLIFTALLSRSRNDQHGGHNHDHDINNNNSSQTPVRGFTPVLP